MPAYHGNLEGWARSGVLLLNTCLTVASGAANSHAGQGWEAFTDALIVEVSKAAERGAVFILWGKPAQDKRGLIAGGGKHLVLQAPHPSPLSAFRGFFGSVRPGSARARARAWAAPMGTLFSPTCPTPLLCPFHPVRARPCRSPLARPMPFLRLRALQRWTGWAP